MTIHKEWIVVILFTLFLFNQLGFAGNQESQTLEAYKNLSIDTHLNVAEFKLEDLIQETKHKGDTKKLEKLTEAYDLLWEAIRRYEYFRTQDEMFLAYNWREHYNWAVPNPDTPNLGKSPLSLLDHLRLAYEEAVQIKAQIMVADRQYTRFESQLNQSLNQSVRLMQKTIVAVEESRGWIKYDNPDYGIRISVPPGFKPNTTRENPFPLDLLKTKADGSPEKVVFVRLRREENDVGPEDYQKSRIEEIRQRFPDMLVVERGESKGYSRNFTTSFIYTYTWEGDVVKALVYIRRSGSRVYEINCLALEESFDIEEFDEIIKSYGR